ncbi:endoglucanase 4-like [Glandiceps talaboti]
MPWYILVVAAAAFGLMVFVEESVLSTLDPPNDYYIKEKPAKRPHHFVSLISKSILFYEAQRSGKLPDTNRIDWRGDSCLDDAGRNGEDLTGGWFDAGDHVKFGLPMAWSTTVLAWGFIEFMDGYIDASTEDEDLVALMLDSIQWPCDYFVKCHTKANVFYYQVADGALDHQYWQRPEDLEYDREAFRINGKVNGSDVISGAAAALASCSVALTQAGGNETLAEIYREEAVDLYRLAKKRLGVYPDLGHYENVRWEDELLWAAIWVHIATNDTDYLDEAIHMYEEYDLWGKAWIFGWGDSREGSKLLLYKLTKSDRYKTHIEKYLNGILPLNAPTMYTPRGLYFRDEWGSLRHASAVSFLALVAAQYGLYPKAYREFACNQTNYILGDHVNNSFVIDYGTNPPCKPHHRASSCPDLHIPCTYANAFKNSGCNYHTLSGALVGGPNKEDEWTDNRADFQHNEVACDYNAPFQGAMAALQKLKKDKELPPACSILNSRV